MLPRCRPGLDLEPEHLAAPDIGRGWEEGPARSSVMGTLRPHMPAGHEEGSRRGQLQT